MEGKYHSQARQSTLTVFHLLNEGYFTSHTTLPFLNSDFPIMICCVKRNGGSVVHRTLFLGVQPTEMIHTDPDFHSGRNLPLFFNIKNQFPYSSSADE